MTHDFEEIIFINVWRQNTNTILILVQWKKPYENFKITDEFSIFLKAQKRTLTTY